MPTASSPKPSRVKVREHRQRLRGKGLRPIQIWVPDVRSPAFRSEAHRQSLAVATSRQASPDQAFIDAVSARGEKHLSSGQNQATLPLSGRPLGECRREMSCLGLRLLAR